MVGIREFGAADELDCAPQMQKALDEDGIFVIRNALSQDEIDRLRGVARRHLSRGGRRFSLGRTQPNAAQEVPELAFIFAHPQILTAAKQVLGESDVVFTGHCDIHMNMLSGWHKDSGETVPGGYFSGPYMTSPDCRVYKVAIYLQDTGRHDGFTARLGSHRETDLSVGEAINVQSRTGDIVIFDVRISHTGQLPDPVEKGLKGLSLVLNRRVRDREDRKWVSAAKALYWKVIGRRDRLSVFFTYGAPNTFTDDFAEANMKRQARQGTSSGVAVLPADLVGSLESQGVRLSEALRSR
ncbi:MAG: phytanoyl-CoA dioxygenase family protein [Mycobacterium sp.]